MNGTAKREGDFSDKNPIRRQYEQVTNGDSPEGGRFGFLRLEEAVTTFS